MDRWIFTLIAAMCLFSLYIALAMNGYITR